nr:MAG TPA: hypothetical protein [Caudoviricetes sp.]
MVWLNSCPGICWGFSYILRKYTFYTILRKYICALCLLLLYFRKYIIKTVKEIRNTEGKAMTVKLQGIYNKQEAKAVKELKTGDVIMWNYGYTSTVVDLIPSKTGKTITCLLKSNQDGVVRERKMGAERMVAIA